MPRLLMILIAFALTRSLTQRFSLGTQKRLLCRLGSNRRLISMTASSGFSAGPTKPTPATRKRHRLLRMP